MNANVTIRAIMPIFATHGIPEHAVTDNGGTFRSEEWKRNMSQNGILQTKTVPFHSFTNGRAERFVQTLNRNIIKWNSTLATIVDDISKFLLCCRTTDYATTGLLPSFILMNRHLRNKLTHLFQNFRQKKVNDQCNGKGFQNTKKKQTV